MRVTAANWSQLAEQARAMADDMDCALAKKTLLEIAAGYDRLTARALARQRTRVGQPPRLTHNRPRPGRCPRDLSSGGIVPP
jgi:hypothetical protein